MSAAEDSHDQSQSPPSNTESHSNSQSQSQSKKRTAVDSNGNPKPVKRRAAKACAACRARKVRCDVMQRYHVTPDGEVTCSNCTMDKIKCVIEESKRRKKHLNGVPQTSNTTRLNSVLHVNPLGGSQDWGHGIVSPSDIQNSEDRRWSGSTMSNDDDLSGPHVSHPIYQNMSNKINSGEDLRRHSLISSSFEDQTYSLLQSAGLHGDRTRTRLDSPPLRPVPLLKHQLPAFLKPLPSRMTSVDIDFLYAKGALSLPEHSVRAALFRSYIEYVHPYMPLVDIHEFLQIVNDESGDSGKVSLLLFQAILFTGTAFVDMEFLKLAGYRNRKAARKAFFQRARVLYDFDYEIDRVSLVQSLLLMTYWYETPDDQKDTWHWMGVAISLAHTIGLHRNPDKSNMEPHKKKLWKRIWWSCFMRDRLVALGMRRPTRVKDEDYDVPMLEEDDFEIASLPLDNKAVSPECTLIRDTGAQRQLAQMCIAKAKLCLCVSQVLSAQYSVLVRHEGMSGDGSSGCTVMLFPKKHERTDEVQRCDNGLSNWLAELPESCWNSNEMQAGNCGPPLFVQRSLLHMVFYTTLSALHRPQVLPSANASQPEHISSLQDLSRKRVREASKEITNISQRLHTRTLERYLPTTGVTVLLPAIIIHLLDIKSYNDELRQAATDGFIKCMVVLERLRDIYSSADFATQFLDAAIRKADIGPILEPSREKIRANEAARASAIAGKITTSHASRRTPPLSEEEVQNSTHDFAMSSAAANAHITSSSAALDRFTTFGKDHTNAISARTPESDSFFSPAATTTLNNHNTNNNDNKFNNNTFNLNGDLSTSVVGAAGAADTQIPLDTNVDISEFLDFDSNETFWNFEDGAHGESGGFLGEFGGGATWPDQSWSRLGSPLPEEGVALSNLGVGAGANALSI